MLMLRPKDRDPGEDDASPEWGEAPSPWPFFTFPLLLCGLAFDLLISFTQNRISIIATLALAGFVALSTLILRLLRRPPRR